MGTETIARGSQKTLSRSASSHSTSKLPSFCIILPMFNEECAASECILSIWNHLKTLRCEASIIVVDDGSTDNTAIVLKNLLGQVPCLIIEKHETNKGYGAANRTGFFAAQREGFEYAIVMDADGTQEPRFIERFFEPMSRSVDFIKASRYIKGSAVVGVTAQRRLVSWIGNLVARIILRLPLTDYTNGFRAIKTDLACKLITKERGFSMLVEEVALSKSIKASFAEIPYVLTARTEEGSQSKFVYSTQVYKNYLGCLFKR